jgi:hypothetical protein
VGSLSDRELRHPRRPGVRPGPVSAQQFGDGRGSATLLVPKPRGRWGYGAEIPIRVQLNSLKSVWNPATKEQLFWSGIEVRIDCREGYRDKACEGVCPELGRKPYHITAALWPNPFVWPVAAPLAPGYGGALPDEAMRLLVSGDAGLADLGFDPFETDANVYTARLGDPLRPHGDGWWVARNPWRDISRRGSKTGRKAETAGPTREWFFGLCPEDPETVVQALVGDNLDLVSGDAGLKTKIRHDAKPDDDLAGRILEAAARQSLAGRRQYSEIGLRESLRKNYLDLYENLGRRRARNPEPVARPGATVAEPRTDFEIETAAEDFFRLHRRDCPRCLLAPRTGRLTTAEIREIILYPLHPEYSGECRTLLADALTPAR